MWLSFGFMEDSVSRGASLACVPAVAVVANGRSYGGAVVFRTIPNAFSFPRLRFPEASVRFGIVGMVVLSAAGAVVTVPLVSVALAVSHIYVPPETLELLGLLAPLGFLAFLACSMNICEELRLTLVESSELITQLEHFL